MIRSVIIEQKPLLIKMLDRICPEVDFSVSTKHPKSGLELVDLYHLNLVILDVNASEGCPIELIKRLNRAQIPVVLIADTFFEKICPMALPHCEVIQKPVYGKRLLHAVRKAVLDLVKVEQLPPSDLPEKGLHPKVALDEIAVWKEGFVRFIPWKHVLFGKAEGSGTRFQLTGNKTFFSERSLVSYGRILNPRIAYRIRKDLFINRQALCRTIEARQQVELLEGWILSVEPGKLSGLR